MSLNDIYAHTHRKKNDFHRVYLLCVEKNREIDDTKVVAGVPLSHFNVSLIQIRLE
jgi:hypothetical protein